MHDGGPDVTESGTGRGGEGSGMALWFTVAMLSVVLPW